MAVRVDIIERLADCIRPLIAWRPTPAAPNPPDGAVDGNAFRVTVTMTSLLGCSGEDFASVLRALGYRMERKPAPPPQAVVGPADGSESAMTEPVEPITAAEAAPAEDMDGPGPYEGDGAESADAFADAVDAVEFAAKALEAGPAQDEAEAATVDLASSTGDFGTDAAVVVPEMAAESGAAGPPVEGEAAPTGEAPAAEAVAELAFIEIWRPHRFGRRPEQRNKGRPRHSGETRPEGQPAQTEAGASRPPRHDRRKDVRHAERPEGSQKGRPPRHGPRRDGQDRPPRPERQERPERQKQADPLSPYAALAALKAQLEAQKRDG
jgi:ATP-dependent RNA helicase SUPV3L1/SUV3